MSIQTLLFIGAGLFALGVIWFTIASAETLSDYAGEDASGDDPQLLHGAGSAG